jgi:hypothetical protein
LPFDLLANLSEIGGEIQEKQISSENSEKSRLNVYISLRKIIGWIPSRFLSPIILF